MPVYLWRADRVIVGTMLGERLLFGLSAQRFRRIVSMSIGALGIWLLVAPPR